MAIECALSSLCVGDYSYLKMWSRISIPKRFLRWH